MRALVAALMLLLALPASAVQPDEMLDDPVLEERAREISKNLRCLVCQNQSIDDSNAGLARDLRLLVRERIEAGDSDREVIDHIVARYGDYVLLNPPMKSTTWLLWFGPLVFLAVGAAVAVAVLRRRAAAAAAAPLSEAERRRAAELLRGSDEP